MLASCKPHMSFPALFTLLPFHFDSPKSVFALSEINNRKKLTKIHVFFPKIGKENIEVNGL